MSSEDFREKHGDNSQVEALVEEAEERSEEIDLIDEELEVETDWTESEFIVSKMKGVRGRTESATKIKLWINTETEEWKQALKSQFPHEDAHTVFFYRRGLDIDSNIENWRHILLEAHSQHFSEKAYPRFDAPWRTKFSEKEISESWTEIERLMDVKVFEEAFFDPDERPPWLPYSVSYRIGSELLKHHMITELPDLGEEEVAEAGNRLFARD